MKCVLLADLPNNESDFSQCHAMLFPTSFDIKMMLQHPAASSLGGSLQDVGFSSILSILHTLFIVKVANQLQVCRIGQRHQAGSDSLLTAMTFFSLKERVFSDCWDEVGCCLF